MDLSSTSKISRREKGKEGPDDFFPITKKKVLIDQIEKRREGKKGFILIPWEEKRKKERETMGNSRFSSCCPMGEGKKIRRKGHRERKEGGEGGEKGIRSHSQKGREEILTSSREWREGRRREKKRRGTNKLIPHLKKRKKKKGPRTINTSRTLEGKKSKAKKRKERRKEILTLIPLTRRKKGKKKKDGKGRRSPS